jgi:hypothetical protein
MNSLSKLVFPPLQGLWDIWGLNLVLQDVVELLEGLDWQRDRILHVKSVLQGPASRDRQSVGIYEGGINVLKVLLSALKLSLQLL